LKLVHHTITSAVTESTTTTALLGLLTALRHRADSVLDNKQNPYSDESDIKLLSAAQLSADMTPASVSLSTLSSETLQTSLHLSTSPSMQAATEAVQETAQLT